MQNPTTPEDSPRFESHIAASTTHEEQPLLASAPHAAAVSSLPSNLIGDVESLSEKESSISWWNRRNRCIRKLSNRTCCIYSTSACFFLVTPTILLLLVFVIIPLALRAIIDNAPPAYVNVIDIRQMFVHNVSAGVWFQADLDLRALPTEFHPATFEVSILRPNQMRKALRLGRMDLGSFSTSLISKVNLNFYSVGHHFELINIRKVFGIASDHLTSVFTDSSSLDPIANEDFGISRVKKDIWRLRLNSKKISASLAGMTFHNINLNYDIGIQTDAKNFIQNFNPKLIECTIGSEAKPCSELPGMQNAMDQYIFTLGKRFKMEEHKNGEVNDDFVINLKLELGNPTVFGLNLGFVEIDIGLKQKGEYSDLAIIRVPNLNIMQTGRNSLKRQIVEGKVQITNIFTIIAIRKLWDENKKARIAIGDIRFLGYQTEEGGVSNPPAPENRIKWLEEALKDFRVHFDVPKLDL